MSHPAAFDQPVPTELEVVANLLLGEDVPVRSLPDPTGVGPRAALEAVVLPALRRPPCLVSFSGGRDSSAILAIATHVARREGLDLPVPAMMRFPPGTATDETSWQELVLDHLGLTERVELRLDEELDAVGSAAGAELRRRGVRWPVNIHMHVPVVDAARGGSVLTGVGGDEVFDTRASRFVLLAHRAARPVRADLRTFVADVAPRGLRRAHWRRRRAPHYPWLTPAGRAMVDEALARDVLSFPHRWDAAIRVWFRSRAFSAVQGALPELAAAHGATLLNPFVDPAVLAEHLVAGGATGYPSRTEAMGALVGDLLPRAVVERSTKGVFTGALCGPATRSFARSWDGSGVDRGVVDVDAIRREWLADAPNANSILLLQSAWLATGAPVS